MVLSTATQSHHVTKSISGILAAADAGEPGIEKLLLAALSGLKVPNLEQLIAAGNLDQAMAAVAATQISPADLDTIADLISAITLTVARPEAVALWRSALTNTQIVEAGYYLGSGTPPDTSDLLLVLGIL